MAIDVAFALVEHAAVEPSAIVTAAGGLGLTLTQPAGQDPESPLTFELEGGGTFLVLPIDAPHPDAPTMPRGPLSPDAEAIAGAAAHLILTGMDLPGDQTFRDATMARLLAAVTKATPAVAAMLGHGVVWHRIDVLSSLLQATKVGGLPVEVCVDLTVAREPKERMSFLTHGLPRYGREDFFITAPVEGGGALDFVLSMMRWMIADPDKTLPTGDTVGRSAEERVIVQREPSPTGEDREVIRLDLP